MAGENQGAVQRGLERLFNRGSLTGLSEGQILRQFAAGDAGAFEALVSRHGPMVLGVCRRLLSDSSDVEDAFQATFLVLLRKAGALRDAEVIGPWLHDVACKVAARIRSNEARRPARESKGARPEAVAHAGDLERVELRTVIDAEILRLPEKYRRPVVLCYVEGRTHEEAARRLRCSTGSLRGRLDRARQKLKDRLTRRGLAPAAGLTALAAGAEVAHAAVPAPLIAATVATLARTATATAVSGAAPASALQLADGVFRAMLVAKLKLAGSFLAAAAVILADGAAWLLALGGSLAGDGQDGRATAAAQGAGPAQKSPDRTRMTGGPSIEIRVVDRRTGKPLPGVALAVEADRKAVQRATTDDAGRAAVALPEPLPKSLTIAARKDGFAPVTLWFPSPIREAEIPASYTLKLYPAEAIGGLVQDEQRRPVAGARVAPMIALGWAEIPNFREILERPAPATTDAEGRWRCAGMPAGIERERVSIAFEHPDYQHVLWQSEQALDDLKRGKATVLPRGLDLAGRVVDPDGRPIRGARVLGGLDPSGRDITPAVTDADGRFRLAHLPARSTVLTVEAPGYAPDSKEVVPRPGLAPIEFRLGKGRIFQGRVVDAKGEPLAGANIVVDSWRGVRTLDRRMTTDGDGQFRWTDAPLDAFWINVWHEGYLQILRREVPPAAGDLTITLLRELKVRGTVVDAATRHAIPTFTVVPGTERGVGSPTYWELNRSQAATRGRYEIVFNSMMQQQGRRLRIEAEGYKPAVSRIIRDDEDDPVVNFVLEKGVGVSGVVHAPDGSPLDGADVVLVTPSDFADFNNGRLRQGIRQRVVKSGGDGRFTFPPQEPPYTVVVLHDRGFAQQTVRDATAAPAADLTVQPWGRIEGTLRIGQQPGARQTLHLGYTTPMDPYGSIPMWSGEARSDESGRFTFERVMPGTVTISRMVLVKTSATMSRLIPTGSTAVDVAPGATARLTLGGTGRPIIGKVTAPAGYSGPIDWAQSTSRLTPTPKPLKDLLSFLGGKKARRPDSAGSMVPLQADGSFRVEDVEAGTYELSIMVFEPPGDPNRPVMGNNPIATARREVVVPAMPGGRSDEPLDLGAIPVTIVMKPATAPGARKD